MTTWPDGMRVKPIMAWPGRRNPDPRPSPFSASWSSTISLLWRELYQINGRNVILQVDIPERLFRVDGFPRADARADSAGIILTLDSQHGALSYPCDAFTKWQDNLRAIALALEALRKVDRYGVTKRGEQYTGFKAIGSGAIAVPAAMSEADARVVILRGASMHAEATGVDLRGAFRLAQRYTHPDQGGKAADFDRVMQAGRVLGFTS